MEARLPAVILVALLAAVAGAAVGALVALTAMRARASEAEARARVAEARLDEVARGRDADVRAAAERHAGELARLAEQQRHALAAQESRLREVQQRLADSQAQQRARDAADSRVLEALSPVATGLDGLARSVVEMEKERRAQYGALGEQLRVAGEAGERLRTTTESLASALRATGTRGVWGETQLRRVVEAAGLLERVDFDVQSTVAGEDGVLRPDLVVHLPGGRSIAVDAKVPLTAFLEAAAIPEGAAGAEGARRAALVADHVRAVRAHVTALGARRYWDALPGSPELVIAFLPSESLVSAALGADASLLDHAFAQKVAVASPVTLWSVLKTVASAWQHHALEHEAQELVDAGRELYRRLATTSTRLEKLGRSIRGSVNDYNAFVGSLERNVLPSARRLERLGAAEPLPSAPLVEESPRPLAAPELTADTDAGAP